MSKSFHMKSLATRNESEANLVIHVVYSMNAFIVRAAYTQRNKLLPWLKLTVRLYLAR